MLRYNYWFLETSKDVLAKLKAHELFNDDLLPDIQNGSVFPAIRGRKIDFYYLGCKICTYANGMFQTNIAYLAAFKNKRLGEVTEDAFRRLVLCESFHAGYSQIKENISYYTKPESYEVSKLCGSHSCYKKDNLGPIVILDIELSLLALDEERKQDRIDLVLFHRSEKRIRIVEVKMFENKELWPIREGNDAKVVLQIARYKYQLCEKHKDLTESYCQYVRLLSDLFGTTLSEPLAIDKDVDLLVTGFDETQLQTIKTKLLPAFGVRFRTNCRGSLSKVSQGTLAKWWNNKKVVLADFE